MPGRSNGLCVFASLDELLCCFGSDTCVLFGLKGGLLVAVSFFCIFEDIDKMFALLKVSIC